MARHIEHPGSRQSKPASRKISGRPSASACCLTRPEPGTTRVRMPSATLRPLATAAAARRSSIRLFVQLPMKTVSTLMSLIGVPASKSMYSRARAAVLARFGSSKSSGPGITPSIGMTWAGLVPQLTCGAMSAASMITSSSKTAPSSVASVFQSSMAASSSAPTGELGRPATYSNVVSSGAMRPALAPPSIDMLQTVMRPSIDMFSKTSPRYSMILPIPPPVPITPIT